MDHAIIQRAEHALHAACGIPLETLLAPIDAANPVGAADGASAVHAAIKHARKADDTSLPLGPWEHELKHADWDRVARLAADALAHQAKDLQLAVWLLEAQMQRLGFSAIAGCLHLIRQLCENYWEDLHPHGGDTGTARRANILGWINRKLPPIVRQIPVAMGAQQQAYCLADWERARRHDQHRQAEPGSEPDGPGAAELSDAMAATPSDICLDMERDLADAAALLQRLSTSIGERMGREAPSLGAFGAALEQARALFDAELYRRGARRAPAANEEVPPQQHRPGTPPAQAAMPASLLRDRIEAYARLDEVAAFLLQLEPHSPVPYLIRRASEWGQLNAVALYHELFMRLNGQINIFEMMGLAANDAAPGGQA